GFSIQTDGETYETRHVVLATGGRSLPKSGSDGAGYGFARQLGHGFVETTPALVPLLLDGNISASLAGVSHLAAVTFRAAGKPRLRLDGAMLWTHVGISGPVILNASRHWLRARLEGVDVDTRLSVCPSETFESIESWLLAQQRDRPRAAIRST